MYQQDSKTLDKTIVERRVAHKGDKSRQAVKNLRTGAMSNGGQVGSTTRTSFEAEVLQRHAQCQPIAQFCNTIIAALVGYAIFIQTSVPVAVGWFLLALIIVLTTLFTARSYRADGGSRRKLSTWRAIFQILATLSGLSWTAAFIVMLIMGSGVISTELTLSATFVATALAFAGTRFLKHGIFLTTAPLALIFLIWMMSDVSSLSIVYTLLVLAFVASFCILGAQTRESHIEFLNSKAKRDQLVMELNDSRAISDEARRRAEDANLAKSRFLATMSHELRTPLNAILGFSEVMSNEVMGPLGNDHYKEYIGDIHRSGAHLLKLINEILDLSRVEAGRYELNEEATDLSHSAEESHQMIKLKASEKNVAINMLIQPDLPQIWADPRAVRQVILNLLSNALKFTPSGGSIYVKVGWTAGGGQYVSIRDTGPGIPEDEIPIVLSSFGQGSIAIKSAEQGTGLGLPIVQALVHMHDGKFELKSKLREGTEVIATFPRGRVMEVMSPVAVESPSSAPRSVRKFQKDGRKSVAAPAMTS